MKAEAPKQNSIIRRLVISLLVLLLLVTIVGITGTYTKLGEEREYPTVACELRFVDSNGQPVEGVSLQLETPAGVASYHQPINDFYPKRIPTSDKDGVLRFHCYNQKYHEIEKRYFHLIVVNIFSPPDYICRFTYQGNSVHTVPFNAIIYAGERQQLPTVKRTIAFPTTKQVSDESVPTVSELPHKTVEIKLIQKEIEI